jgi:hypothetical protein
MTSLAVGQSRASGVAALRMKTYRFAAWHPEWWLAAVALVAWLVIVTPGFVGSGSVAPMHHDHHDMVPTDGLATFDRMVPAASAWLFMLAAMMLPILVPRVRRVASCCVGVVRNRAIAETVAGALLPWCALGVGVVVVVSAIPSASGGRLPVQHVVTWLAVAGWQLSPMKRTALRRCCVVQVPRGAEDRWLRVRAGASHSVWCTVSCGPAMVAMAWTGHSTGLMALLTVGLTAERVALRPDQVSRLLAAGVVTAALVAVSVAVGS